MFRFLFPLFFFCVSIQRLSSKSIRFHNISLCDCAKEVLEDLWRIEPVQNSQLREIIIEDLSKKITKNYLHYPTRKELKSVLYNGKSPYAGVNVREYMDPEAYPSTAKMLSEPLRNHILRRLGYVPSFMVEVGSFVGTGAIFTWAPIMNDNGVDGIVLCIDTWQGDLNMRLGKEFQSFMNLSHGHPQVYSKFLQRVVQHELEDTIYPFPISSIEGARLLQLTNWKIDVIYIDTAHEIGETFAEIMLYYQLLPPGGLLIGDDYALFPAVQHDVNLFVEIYSQEIIFDLMIVNGEAMEWSILKLNKSLTNNSTELVKDSIDDKANHEDL